MLDLIGVRLTSYQMPYPRSHFHPNLTTKQQTDMHVFRGDNETCTPASIITVQCWCSLVTACKAYSKTFKCFYRNAPYRACIAPGGRDAHIYPCVFEKADED